MKHGANIYKYAKEIDVSHNEIIDFSSNINLHQPEIEIKLNSSITAKYANASYKEIRKVIAQKYEIKRSQIYLFNGATSAIYELFRFLKRKDVFLYAPLYSEYEKAAIKYKKNIYKINRLSEAMEKPQEDSIVVFVNPSTPEGYYENMQELMSMWIELNCTIILDESFLEFEALKSMRKEINNYKKLYIIQSFSKFNSCAGVRIGAIFSHKKNIEKIHTPIWNISSLDVEFLKQRFQDTEFIQKSLELHVVQKKELLEILTNSKLFNEIVDSDANFILTHSLKAEEIFEHLLENKILVRTCGSFDFLSDEWLRFAVKDESSHKELQRVLNELS